MAFDIRETIFELPENWKLVRLGDIAKVNEKSLTKKSQLDFIRYIDISSVSTGSFDTPKILNINNAPSRAKRILRDNDFIISTVRPNLKQFSFIEEAKNNLIASTGFCVVSSENSELGWYLYSLVTSDLFTEYLVKIADGGAYPAFNPKEIEDAIIPLPNKSTLKFISNTAKSFHQKIQLNTQINQTLEQIAQAIFKSWFVDFDPVRAKADALAQGKTQAEAELAAQQIISGKTPEELTALSQTHPDQYAELAEIAKAFPSEFEEVEGFGEVPRGWELRPFGEVLESTIGGDWGKEKPDQKHTENVFIFRGTDLPNIYKGDIEDTPNRYIALNKLKNRKVKFGDIIIEVSGGSKNQPTGRSLFITNNLLSTFKNNIIPASFCRLFRPQNEKIGIILATHLKMIYEQGKTWEYQVQSTGISNFQTNNFLENEKVILPNNYLIDEFYNEIVFIYEKMTTKENNHLKEIRDLLLPRLLNGDIKL